LISAGFDASLFKTFEFNNNRLLMKAFVGKFILHFGFANIRRYYFEMLGEKCIMIFIILTLEQIFLEHCNRDM
jgi:hypothetical protein